MVSDARIELALLGPKPRVIPFHQSEKNLVPPQRIELRTDAYKATVIPLNYRGEKLVVMEGIEPPTSSV